MTPVCVDLDGTFIFNDLVRESIILFLRKYPYKAPLLLGWQLKGFAYVKCEVAKRVLLSPDVLHYNDAVLSWLKKQDNPLYLVTGSPQVYANSVAHYLESQIKFQGVYGATPYCRLTGQSKAEFLSQCFSSFIYVGNSQTDIAVWKVCQKIVGVNLSSSTKKWIMSQGKEFEILS